MCVVQGLTDGVALAAGTQTDSKQGSIFVTGLLAGTMTFGGAFTAVPYVYRSFVTINHFITPQQVRRRPSAPLRYSPSHLRHLSSWTALRW